MIYKDNDFSFVHHFCFKCFLYLSCFFFALSFFLWLYGFVSVYLTLFCDWIFLSFYFLHFMGCLQFLHEKKSSSD